LVPYGFWPSATKKQEMSNIIPHNFSISAQERAFHKGHKGLLVWFTGLSGSGKSTIANALEQQLFQQGMHTYVLDGDTIRKGLNNDLSFSAADRTENIRRIAEVANLMVDAGLVVLAAFVSPYKKDRAAIRQTVGTYTMVEVFVDTPLSVCEERDVKGLYAKARAGEISNFTGISAPYEAPTNPEVRIDTTNSTVVEAVETLMAILEPKLKPNG